MDIRRGRQLEPNGHRLHAEDPHSPLRALHRPLGDAHPITATLLHTHGILGLHARHLHGTLVPQQRQAGDRRIEAIQQGIVRECDLFGGHLLAGRRGLCLLREQRVHGQELPTDRLGARERQFEHEAEQKSDQNCSMDGVSSEFFL